MFNHHESLECRRLLASGAIDLSFGNAGVVTAPFGADVKLGKPVVLGNGKILVPGSAPGAGGRDIVLLRYSADGTLDTSFDGDGIVQRDFGGDDRAVKILLDSAGRIMLLGNTVGKTLLARFSSNGKIDKSWGVNGATAFEFAPSQPLASDFVLRPDDKIILSGGSYLSRRYADGSLDKVFGKNGHTTFAPVSVNDYDFDEVNLTGLARQSTGALIVVGSVPFVGGYIMRVDAGGKIDKTFAGNGMIWFTHKEERLSAIAIQQDNKIVAVGNDYDSTSYVHRLNANGTLDSSFLQNSDDGISVYPQTYNSASSDVAIQSDGKIVILFQADGDFGDAAPGIARVNGNGTADTSFAREGMRTVNFTSSLDDHHTAGFVAIANDGDVIVSGSSNFGINDSRNPSKDRSHLARLQSSQTTAIKYISGTTGDDTVGILHAEEGKTGPLRIFLNDVEVARIEPADYASLQIDLGAGNDQVIQIGGLQLDSDIYKSLPMVLIGGKGNDTLYGDAAGDTLSGGAGDDSLDGGAGDDYIEGNSGHDILVGGAGRDRLFGGTGNDQILAKDGAKDLVDGQAGDDVLEMDGVDGVLG